MPRVSELHVNGKLCRIDVDTRRSLLSVLREELDLTGCKYGCGESQCGACTVLIDGKAKRSCMQEVGEIAGSKIVTIEGLEHDEQLHPVQEAFLKTQALQCGYCTCGMIMSAVALLDKTPSPTEEEITRAMNGNICRCGVYQRIREAIKEAAQTMGARR